MALTALTDAALPKAKEPTFLFRGETVPVSEVSEHMRIELMDPRWKEQREAAERKSKETNLGPGMAMRGGRPILSHWAPHSRCPPCACPADAEVIRHLQQMAKRRSDIFGTEDAEVRLASEKSRR